MIYAAPSGPGDSLGEPRQEIVHSIPAQLVARKEPIKQSRSRFTFRQLHLPVESGRLLLRLNHFPQLEVDPDAMEFEVVDWGVRMPCAEAEKLPKAMARRFLYLFGKADEQSLSEEEENAWIRILDRVDFQRFCTDRAAPHYVEGTLVRLDPVCLVNWHDGERQKIPPRVAESLAACLEPGDKFGAYVKFGRDDAVTSIERILPLMLAE